MQTELSFANCYIAMSVLDSVLANHKWGSDSAKSPLSTEVQPLYDKSGENQAKEGEIFKYVLIFIRYLFQILLTYCTNACIKFKNKESNSCNTVNEYFGWRPRDRSKMLLGKFENLRGLTNLLLRYLHLQAAGDAPRNGSGPRGEGESSWTQKEKKAQLKDTIKMLNVEKDDSK